MSRSSGAPTPLSFGKAGRSLKRRKMRLPTAWHGSCQTRRSFVQGLSRGVGTDYHSQMTLSITSAFDGGNIRILDISGHRADLEIVKDQNSDFHQWFRSEEHTSELQSLMRISYAVFCLKKNNKNQTSHTHIPNSAHC